MFQGVAVVRDLGLLRLGVTRTESSLLPRLSSDVGMYGWYLPTPLLPLPSSHLHAGDAQETVRVRVRARARARVRVRARQRVRARARG